MVAAAAAPAPAPALASAPASAPAPAPTAAPALTPAESSHVPPVAADTEVKPYRIKVSSKYTERTRQKLEISRLPHDGANQPSSEGWWKPKDAVERLIDYWLEKYEWKAQAELLNHSLPQFRAAVAAPPFVPSPLRIHFVHVPSPRPHAVPLLLLPPFPFTSLSLSALIAILSDPPSVQGQDGADHNHDPNAPPPFNLVIPTLPGLGFSDPLPSTTATATATSTSTSTSTSPNTSTSRAAHPIAATAALLDALMTQRLGYARYLVATAGPASASPAAIDWRIAHRLATRHGASCVGASLISPPLAPPRWTRSGGEALEWAKWAVARRLRRPECFGYRREDVDAAAFICARRTGGKEEAPVRGASSLLLRRVPGRQARGGMGGGGLMGWPPASAALLQGHDHLGDHANALAYALCDSPTGLLVVVLALLRALGGGERAAAEKVGEDVAAAATTARESPEGKAATSTVAEEEAATPATPATKIMGLTQEEIITLTQLAWLPGPEAALRFWAQCASRYEEGEEEQGPEDSTSTSTSTTKRQGRGRDREKGADGGPRRLLKIQARQPPAAKPKVAITVFLEDDDDETAAEAREQGAEPGKDNNNNNNKDKDKNKNSSWRLPYAPPAWARRYYDVVHAQRAVGRPGLLAQERPEVVADAARGLAKGLWYLFRDDPLPPSSSSPSPSQPPAAVAAAQRPEAKGKGTSGGGGDEGGADGVAVVPDDAGDDNGDGNGNDGTVDGGRTGSKAPPPPQIRLGGESSDAAGEQNPKDASASKTKGDEQASQVADGGVKRADHKEAALPTTQGAAATTTTSEKGALLEPPPPIRSPFSEGSSPDTLVVNTPPLDAVSE